MNKLAICALSALSVSAFAEDDTKTWSADAEFGLISTSGNTTTSSVKAKLDVSQELTQWRNQYILEGLYKQDEVDVTVDDVTTQESQTTAQKYFASVQSDYKLDAEHKGFFVYGSYEDDRFSGYAYQGTFAIGYSDRLFKTDKSHLNYSVGPGMAFSKTEDTIEAGIVTEGEENQNAVVRLSAAYLYKISSNAKFTQTLSSDVSAQSGENSKTKAETALTANISSAFALKASFTVNHNTHVPEEKKHADTQTAITLVFSY